MGRALVLGALGMRTDDPKYFEATVKLPECTVILQSTQRKAKAPVSAPPPNSIESDRDINESGDLQLSESATDVGVFVELPGAGVESINQEMNIPRSSEDLADVCTTGAPEAPGVVATRVISPRSLELSGESRRVVSEARNEYNEAIEEIVVVEPKGASSAEC